MQATILVNANVHTMDAAGTRAEAVAWRDGLLIARGSREDVARVAGDGARTWDAGGRTVLPGFIDAHHHASIVALYGGLVRLSPPRVTDIASFQRALADAAAGLAPGEWLVAMDWDETILSEHRAPTRQELDEAIPDRPLFAMHYSCHRAVANSRALDLAGIGKDTADPAGGVISRGRGGLPDGLLIERGMSRVETLARASLVARDAEGFFERLSRHYTSLLAAGITGIADCTVPGDLATLYREAARRGLVTVPTVMCPVSTSGYLETPMDVLDGPRTGEVEGPLTVGPIKLVLDGAPACAMCLAWWQMAGIAVRSWALVLRQRSFETVRTAMSLRPRLGMKVRTGIHIYRPDEAEAMVRAAAGRGFGLATHAVGNAAIEIALAAYEGAGPQLHAGWTPRLEHATFVSRELVRRIAGVGAAVVAQPHFVRAIPAFASAPSIPGLRNGGLRWLLDAGVRVAGSSDHPVAGFDPLDGIRGAVTRLTSRGDVYEPDQRLDLDEAIAMYTRTAAEVCGWAQQRGTLEVGKRADLVVLDGKLSRSSLASARVAATVIGGETVFGS